MTLRFGFRLELPLVTSTDAREVRCWSLGSHYVACADRRRIFVVDTFTGAIVDDGEAPSAVFGRVPTGLGAAPLLGAEYFHVASLDDGTFVLPCYSDELDFHWLPARWTPGVGFEWGTPYVGPDVPDGYQFAGRKGSTGASSAFFVDVFGTGQDRWDQGSPTLVHLGGSTFWSAGPRSEWNEDRTRRIGSGDTVMATFEVYDDGGLRIRRLSGPFTYPRVDDALDQGQWNSNVGGVAVPFGGSIVWPLGHVQLEGYLVVVPPHPDYAGHMGHVVYMSSDGSAISGVTPVPVPAPREEAPYHESVGVVEAPYSFVLDDSALRLPYGRHDWGFRELVVGTGSVTTTQLAPPPAGFQDVLGWGRSPLEAPVRMRPGVSGVTYRPVVDTSGPAQRRPLGLLAADGTIIAMAPPPPRDVDSEWAAPVLLPSGDAALVRFEEDRAAFYFFVPPLPPRELRAGSHRKRGYFT